MISQILNHNLPEFSLKFGLSFLARGVFQPASAILVFTGALTSSISSITQSESLKRLSRVIHRTAIIAILSGSLIQPLLHEWGHAAMVPLFFRSPAIQIALDGLGGGATSYLKNGSLTWLGNQVGVDNAVIAITAGGFLSAMAIGLCSGSSLMIYVSMAKLLSEACYAITALSSKGWDCGHDYQFLHLYAGAHPLIPTAILLGIFLYRMHEALRLETSTIA